MESLRVIVFSSRTTPTQKAGRLLVGSRANGSQDAAAIPSVPAQSVRTMASGPGKRSDWQTHCSKQWNTPMTQSKHHFSTLLFLFFLPFTTHTIAQAVAPRRADREQNAQ